MKNIRNKIELLGYNFKNELLMFAIPEGVMFIASIILTILFKNVLAIGLGFMFMAIYVFSFYYKYSKKDKRLIEIV